VLARALLLVSELHLLRSEAVAQAAAIEGAMEHARQAGDPTLEAELAFRSVPPILFGSVPVEEGLRYIDRLSALAGSLPALESFALHARGHLWARLGEFDNALEAIEQWRRPFPELGQEVQYAASAGCVWDVCSLSGEWEAGERALREAYETFERMGDRSRRATIAAQLGNAALRHAHLDEAEELSRVSEDLGVEEDRLNESMWRSLRARVHAARGEHEHAEQLAREAVAIAEETDYLELAAGAWLDLAEVLRAGGSGDAPSAAREALERYERKGNVVAAARAAALLDAGSG
jgi:tetratricopeptide (TPR) repeat protein